MHSEQISVNSPIGRVVVITGANTGIGFAAAKALVAQGAHVIIGCRDAAKAKEAVSELGALAEALPLDLQSFESVNAFADAFLAKKLPLHVLINNAGILGPKTVETKEGFEVSFLTNHLGHFLLTQRLLGALLATKGKVVNVASRMHFSHPKPFDPDLAVGKNYDSRSAYGMSKLANILHAAELVRRYGDKGLHAYSLHPGVVDTQMLRKNSPNSAGIPVDEGAQTVVFLATEDDAKLSNGSYYFEKAETNDRSDGSRSKEDALRVWEYSEKAVEKSLAKQ